MQTGICMFSLSPSFLHFHIEVAGEKQIIIERRTRTLITLHLLLMKGTWRSKRLQNKWDFSFTLYRSLLPLVYTLTLPLTHSFVAISSTLRYMNGLKNSEESWESSPYSFSNHIQSSITGGPLCANWMSGSCNHLQNNFKRIFKKSSWLFLSNLVEVSGMSGWMLGSVASSPWLPQRTENIRHKEEPQSLSSKTGSLSNSQLNFSHLSWPRLYQGLRTTKKSRHTQLLWSIQRNRRAIYYILSYI